MPDGKRVLRKCPTTTESAAYEVKCGLQRTVSKREVSLLASSATRQQKIEVTGVLAIFRLAESLLLRLLKLRTRIGERIWGLYPELWFARLTATVVSSSNLEYQR